MKQLLLFLTTFVLSIGMVYGQDDTVYPVTEVNPEINYDALSEYLETNDATNDKIFMLTTSNRSIARIIVECDGSVSNVEILKTPDPLSNEAAINLLNGMPKCKPGMIGGKNVRSQIVFFFLLSHYYSYEDGGVTVTKFGKEGLKDWFMKELKYPPMAEDEYIEGDVKCEFTVDSEGRASDVKVVSPPRKYLDKEAERFVRVHKWIPAMSNGQPVPSKHTLIIPFRLN